MSDEGEVRFARFAHPPNDLGYCGPAADGSLLRRAAGRPGADDLRRAAPRFEGAWPYLRLIAASAGLDDPLDPSVVDGYWLGNHLSEAVSPAAFEQELRGPVDGRTGVAWAEVAAAIADGGRPTHAFHVFSVSPWVGLLARGVVDESLRVLDSCRIGWGELVAIEGDRALIRRRPLAWVDGALALDAPREVWLRAGADGVVLCGPLRPGDRVATHWDWVCDPLTPARLDGLRSATHRQLELVERRLRPVARHGRRTGALGRDRGPDEPTSRARPPAHG